MALRSGPPFTVNRGLALRFCGGFALAPPGNACILEGLLENFGGCGMPAVAAVAEDLDEVLGGLRALRLEAHAAELDAQGLTVVPPERTAPAGFAARLREAVLQLAERRPKAQLHTTAGQAGETWMWRILFAGRVFEEALMNPAGLALVSHLLGNSAKLSSSSALIKNPAPGPAKPLGLHSDNRGVPAPFAPYAQVAAVTWALTDYSLENGALGYLPGSHKLCRQPTPDESLDAVVPVQAPAGSLIVWHGHTWHGPFPRTAPGLRISALFYFCREYMATQERYGDAVPPQLLARNPTRFRTLMGLADPYGWDERGPNMERLRASRSGRSQFS